jgi:predicted nuclease of predicted toxin-antitoxin system
MAQPAASLFVALYTDEDVTDDLAPALRRRGYDAQSTAEAGNLSLSDEDQLRYAAEQGRAILTYNIEDFILLAHQWHEQGIEHAGIILSEQFSQRQFGELLRQLLRLLDSLTADEMRQQIIYLQHFKSSLQS